MAKVAALVSAFCIIAFAAVASAHNKEVFNVEGDVYCDPCRVQFETKLSEKISGATVKLTCTDQVTKSVTYSVEGLTNADGHYSLAVEGDHEDDICEVSAISSPRSDCNVPFTEVAKSRIVCTENSGMHATVRFANPLGFMTSAPGSGCLDVLKGMELFVDL